MAMTAREVVEVLWRGFCDNPVKHGWFAAPQKMDCHACLEQALTDFAAQEMEGLMADLKETEEALKHADDDVHAALDDLGVPSSRNYPGTVRDGCVARLRDGFAKEREQLRLLGCAIALLTIAKCPCCDGTGATAVRTSSRQLVTREMAMDAGEPAMEGSLYSDDEWEQQECQWCDEKKTLLERWWRCGKRKE